MKTYRVTFNAGGEILFSRNVLAESASAAIALARDPNHRDFRPLPPVHNAVSECLAGLEGALSIMEQLEGCYALPRHDLVQTLDPRSAAYDGVRVAE